MDRSRTTTLAAVVVALVVAVAALRGFVAASGWFYWDDLILHGLAAAHELPGPDLLLHAHDGHLMPGGMLLAWIAAHTAPLQFWMPVAQMVVLQLAAGAVLARLLWVLTRGNPLLLLPLVWALVTPLSLPSSTWWAAALNSQPLTIAMAWAATAAVLLARTGRRRQVASGIAATVFGLLFVEKALLAPVFAALVLLGWWYVTAEARGGPGPRGRHEPDRLPFRDLLRRTRVMWIGVAVVVVGWVFVYASVVGNPLLAETVEQPPEDGSTLFGLLDRTYRLAVLPAIGGGPWVWERWHPSPVWAAPGNLAIAAGVLVVGFCLVWALRTRERTWPVWLVVAVYPMISVIAVDIVRVGADTALEIVQTLRYHDDFVVVFATGIALSVAAVRRTRGTGPPTSVNTTRAAAVALLVLVIVSSAVSTVTYRSAWAEQPSRDYFLPLLENLGEYDDPVLDQELPLEVLLPVTRPANRLSYAVRGVEGIPPIGDWAPEPTLLSPSGELLPAEVTNGRDIVEGPEEGCGYRATPDGTRMELDGPLLDRDWIVTLNYFASSDGEVELRLDTGEVTSVPVSEGLGTVYARLVGSGTGVVITPGPEVGDLCVGSGPVGVLVPR